MAEPSHGLVVERAWAAVWQVWKRDRADAPQSTQTFYVSLTQAAASHRLVARLVAVIKLDK
tara:strand:+ start:509 stop:691 length:183 start_codon:yes stop_codon:yes gene_type:complete